MAASRQQPLHPPEWLIGVWDGSPGGAMMRVDESGIAVRQADEWEIVRGPGGARTLIAEPRIHVNHTQVQEEHRDDDQSYRIVALDGKKFEAFLQADGSVQVVAGDFRGAFADLYDALGGREEVRKDLQSRQLSHMEISKKYAKLARAHPREWAAFHDGQLAALGTSRDDVLASIDRQNIRRSRVVIQFIDPEPKTWILQDVTVHGSFDGTGRPRVAAEIILPSLRARTSVVFMVDTGADTTVLSRSDAQSLGVVFDSLEDPHDVGGIGGTTRMYSLPAAVCLYDGSNERSFDILIGIPERIADNGGSDEMPSLLGRDIINQSMMVYDSPRRKLELVFPLPTSEETHLF